MNMLVFYVLLEIYHLLFFKLKKLKKLNFSFI